MLPPKRPIDLNTYARADILRGQCGA